MKLILATFLITGSVAISHTKSLVSATSNSNPERTIQKMSKVHEKLDRDALQRRENQYTAGVLHKDVKLLDAVWADTFVDTNETGQMSSKSEQLKKTILSKTIIKSIVVDQERIDFYNNTAIVTERFRVSYIEKGKVGSETGRATDVWVKQNGQWMCVAAHSSAQSGH
jgi:hypothetical protein